MAQITVSSVEAVIEYREEALLGAPAPTVHSGLKWLLMDLGAEEPWASMFAANDWSDAAFATRPFYQHSDGTGMDKVNMGNAGYARIAQVAARTLLRIRK